MSLRVQLPGRTRSRKGPGLWGQEARRRLFGAWGFGLRLEAIRGGGGEQEKDGLLPVFWGGRAA